MSSNNNSDNEKYKKALIISLDNILFTLLLGIGAWATEKYLLSVKLPIMFWITLGVGLGFIIPPIRFSYIRATPITGKKDDKNAVN